MDKDFINSLLLTSVKNTNIETNAVDFYLFGSFLYSKNPNDIDLLIVYNSNKVGITDVLSLRKTIYNLFLLNHSLIADITILSKQEEREVNFISSERAEKL
ncbi:hypothetical protein [Ornithinibacillus xuwenensis]|uniref:Polymerase beta nucleotidyltransferase domain-containing protein n=1 Tax=Ornithinibacillus xuwenensis TaxID=3144668 RepID=A0ABU9XI94_9BACI